MISSQQISGKNPENMASFQNVICFVFEQTIAVQTFCNVFYFKTLSMCIFNAVIALGIGFIVDDALFGIFVCLHNLYTVVELHTNFVLIHLGSQTIYLSKKFLKNL